MLKLGGILNFFIALVHLAALPALWTFIRFTGVEDDMLRYAEIHSSIPYLLTVFVTAVFIVFGLYGLSGAGVIRRLPLLRTANIAIGAIYLVRAVAGLVLQFSVMADEPQMLLFSLFAGGIGVLYSVGGMAIPKRTAG